VVVWPGGQITGSDTKVWSTIYALLTVNIEINGLRHQSTEWSVGCKADQETEFLSHAETTQDQLFHSFPSNESDHMPFQSPSSSHPAHLHKYTDTPNNYVTVLNTCNSASNNWFLRKYIYTVNHKKT